MTLPALPIQGEGLSLRGLRPLAVIAAGLQGDVYNIFEPKKTNRNEYLLGGGWGHLKSMISLS